MLTRLELFTCARLAYESPSASRTKEDIFSAFPTVKAVHLWDASVLGNADSDAQYYCLVFEDCLVYAIRGTSSWDDVLADAQFFQEAFQDVVYSCASGYGAKHSAPADAAAKTLAAHRKGARVHRGFLSQYNSIKFGIMSTLFGHVLADAPNKRIVFVGHSLGGALATLAAAGTKALFPQLEVHCASFGSPRVGNAAFAAYFDAVVDSSVRCVNGSDKVTKNPTLGYAHVGGEVRVGNLTPGWFRGFFGTIEEHRLDSYEAALAAAT